MKVRNLPLAGLQLVIPKKYEDDRGFFIESYKKPLYMSLKIEKEFIQDNLVFSQKNTLRGMHFQAPHGQDKLVSCVQGTIFDVAVDIRLSSPTFGKYHTEILDGKDHRQLFIPHGFAHGYCVLSEYALVQYKVSCVYTPEQERGFIYNDPQIGIPWPLNQPIISMRDKKAVKFSELSLMEWFP